jgi:hypothetical protein
MSGDWSPPPREGAEANETPMNMINEALADLFKTRLIGDSSDWMA